MMLVNNLGERIQWETDSVLMLWYYLDGNSIKILGRGPQQLKHDLGSSFFFILFSNVYLFKKIFYWRRVDLQSCINFRCIAKWTSYTYTHIYSSFKILSHRSHYWVLSRLACVIHQALISYLFYIWVYVSSNLPIYPLSSYPLVTII